MRSFARAAAGIPFLVLLAGCLNETTIRLPDDVDWWAVVGHGAMGDAGRLRKATGEPLSVALTGPAWVVGFSDAQLTPLGFADAVLGTVTLQVSEGSAPPWPVPQWSTPLEGAGPLPALTSPLLEERPTCCDGPLSADDFGVLAFEVEGTADLELTAVGHTDTGDPLFVLSNGDVYRATVSGVRRIGQHELDLVVSIVQRHGVYWVVAHDADQDVYRFCSGDTPSSLSCPRQFGPRPSRLHVTDDDILVAVSTSGELLRFPEEPGRSVYLTTEIRRVWAPVFVQVFDDPSSGLVAASPDWSWRLDGVHIDVDIDLRIPFARLGANFASQDGFGEVYAVNMDAPGERTSLVDVRSIRNSQYGVIVTGMQALAGGLVIADDLGYITWYSPSSGPVEIAHIISRPFEMTVAGNDLIIITKDISAQVFYGQTTTNFIAYVLQRRARSDR